MADRPIRRPGDPMPPAHGAGPVAAGTPSRPAPAAPVSGTPSGAPVPRKPRPPIWPWLLVLALVLGVIALVIASMDAEPGLEEEAMVENLMPEEGAQMAQAERENELAAAEERERMGAAGEPITDIQLILMAPDKAVLTDRSVELANFKVSRVVGDKTFYVTPVAKQAQGEMLVVLNQRPTPDMPGTEGRYDVTPGQVLDVHGKVAMVDRDQLKQRGVEDKAVLNKASEDKVAIIARKLDIKEQAPGT